MKYILLLIVSLSFTSCSPKSIENFVEKSLIATGGNKPPSSFKIANIQTMRDYVFDMPDYTIALPSAKEEDFTLMNGWEGATFNDKDLVLYPGKYGIYHIMVTSSVYKYEESERAAEYKDNEYLKIDPTVQYKKHKDGRETNINAHYETHGKENYTCIVTSSRHDEFGKQGIGYSCFKFNKKRTLVKDISIRLAYQKSPTFPKELSDLTNEYTYEDLQKRSQRILDSLYIKDGWEK